MINLKRIWNSCVAGANEFDARRAIGTRAEFLLGIHLHLSETPLFRHIGSFVSLLFNSLGWLLKDYLKAEDLLARATRNRQLCLDILNEFGGAKLFQG